MDFRGSSPLASDCEADGLALESALVVEDLRPELGAVSSVDFRLWECGLAWLAPPFASSADERVREDEGAAESSVEGRVREDEGAAFSLAVEFDRVAEESRMLEEDGVRSEFALRDDSSLRELVAGVAFVEGALSAFGW